MSTMDARDFLRIPVDDVLASLTLDEKVAGLLALITYSNLQKDQSPVRT